MELYVFFYCRLAMKEILNETQRMAERAAELGASAWYGNFPLSQAQSSS